MKINIKEENDVFTGIIEGWLDSTEAAQFATEIQPLIDNADKEIVLDCQGLEYVASSGLRAFLTLRKASAAKGGHITIVNVSDTIREVFTMTGFYTLFDIKDKA